MNVKHSLIYPQTDLDAAPASPLGYPTVRTRRAAPCPGRSDNTVLLVSGPEALNGFRRVKNVGTCTLYIACYDQSGTFLQTGVLKPREEANFFNVPSNTYAIKFGCHSECVGTAILEYDTPNIS